MRPTSVLAFLFLYSTALFALDPDRAVTQYVHDVWDVKDGLPQNSVQAIAQTPDGYLWLGTPSGLARFDGVRFTVFDHGNTAEIRNSNIRALLVDRQGTLWIGTYGGGLARYRDGRFTSYDAHAGLANSVILTLYQDRSGAIWIGTAGGGATRLKDDVATTFTSRDGLGDNRVRSFCEDHAGILWIGTESGLVRRERDGRFSIIVKAPLVNALLEDREHNLWVATHTGALRIRDGRVTALKTSDGLTDDRVNSLAEDRAGNVWLGTYDGLNRFSSGRLASYTTREGLSHSFVSTIHEDTEGSLWIGTSAGGLNRLRDGALKTYSMQEGMPYDVSWPIVEQPQGTLWIGTEGGGLARLQDGVFRAYGAQDGLTSGNVMSLARARQGGLWVGTFGGGLFRFKDERFTRILAGFVEERVSALHEDRSGVLWVGTYDGMFGRFLDGTFVPLPVAGGPPNAFVRRIHESADGSLWLGTNGAGLIHYKDGKFTRLKEHEALSRSIVMGIYEDAAGDLWIGTRGGGLILLRGGVGGRITTFGTRDGLYDDSVLEILEDDRGYLWMSSYKGIFRVAKRELNEFAAGRRRTISPVAFGMSDGMKDNQGTGGLQATAARTADGRLWFSTIKGVVTVDPDRIPFNARPPPVYLEEVLADQGQIEARQGARLKSGTRALEFHYTALSLLQPEKVRFAYKLEGFDREWIDAGRRRTAFYTNVPAGKYEFRVKAANNDGVWNKTGAALSFSIAPYFYQTWLFYTVCPALLILALSGLHRMRLQWLHAKAAVLEERNRIAQEIHDNLAQGFSGILMQLDATLGRLHRAPDLAESHVIAARDLARSSMQEARRSVWALRSPLLEENDLPGAMTTVAKQLVSGTGIDVSVHVVGVGERLAENVELSLLRIAQEAVANAVRHAQASLVNIELHYSPTRVELIVRDDGRGFRAADTVGHGFGLSSMRQRAVALGGNLQVDGSSGAGTELRVTIPRRRFSLTTLTGWFRRARKDSRQ